jgi:hypothetical protein
MDVVGDAVAAERRISGMGLSQLRQFSGDPVHGGIGQLFGCDPAAGDEDFDQPAVDLLIPSSRPLTVRVEPGEKLVQGLLRQNPFFVHGG